MTWEIVLALAVGTYAMRLAGASLRGRVRLSERWERLLSIAALTLLGSFVATSALVESGGFAGWPRMLGVAAGGVLAWWRLPFVAVVVTAAVVTAGSRLVLAG